MRKTAAATLLLSIMLFTFVSLSAQTRPRRVGNASGAPPAPQTSTQTREEQQPTQQTRPPVLRGSTNSGRPPQSTQTETTPVPQNEPEEVDESDIVRVNTTLVTVPVSVMDRNGRYIPNMRQQDFHIYEEGVEQQVAYFASVETPFTVVLLLDTSGSTQFKIEEIQDAAIAFVDQLRQEDRVMIVSFDDDIRVLSELTNDRFILRNAIRRIRTGDGTRLYDAVDYVINQHLNRVSGRKAIVLFTDGVDTTSRHADYQSNLRDAEELDALIYPVQFDTYSDVSGGGSSWPRRGGGVGSSNTTIVDILAGILGGVNTGGTMGGGRGRGRGRGSTGTSRSDYERADQYLGDLAQTTGARRERADNLQNMSQAFNVIAEELRRQYSLGYYPKSPAQTGQRRQIRVRVNQPNLVVRSRDSYISNQSSEPGTSPGQQQQQSRPELRKRSLSTPITE
jgi:Ca-activated chloride channel family protein